MSDYLKVLGSDITNLKRRVQALSETDAALRSELDLINRKFEDLEDLIGETREILAELQVSLSMHGDKLSKAGLNKADILDTAKDMLRSMAHELEREVKAAREDIVSTRVKMADVKTVAQRQVTAAQKRIDEVRRDLPNVKELARDVILNELSFDMIENNGEVEIVVQLGDKELKRVRLGLDLDVARRPLTCLTDAKLKVK